MDPEVLIPAAIFWLACIGLGIYLGAEKGRSVAEGLLISALFGPFGVIVVGLLPTLSSSASASTTGQAGRKKAWRNPDQSDWKDMIDYTGVKDEASELAAKKAAYARYLSVMGPQPKDVTRVGERFSWRCVCDREITTPVQKAGVVVSCPGCGLHLVAPGLRSDERPTT